MSNVIDGFFDKVIKAGMVEVPLEEAQELLRGAVGKATDSDVPQEEARAIASRTYHLAQAFNRALASGDDLTTFAVDEDLVKAIRQDAEGAQIVESVSQAMSQLAERLGTEKETAATSPEPAAAPPPPPAPEEPPAPAQAEGQSATAESPVAATTEPATAGGNVDTGGEPPAQAQEEVHWPADLNTPPDPDGLDEWGQDSAQ